jgi:hypothetical protein
MSRTGGMKIMAIAVPEQKNMGKRKSGESPTRIEEDVLQLARQIVAFKGGTISSLLSETLRPILTEKYETLIRAAAADIAKPKTPKR